MTWLTKPHPWLTMYVAGLLGGQAAYLLLADDVRGLIGAGLSAGLVLLAYSARHAEGQARD